jgi:hypothetical protein
VPMKIMAPAEGVPDFLEKVRAKILETAA